MLKIKKTPLIPILTLLLLVIACFSIYKNYKLQLFKGNCEIKIESQLKIFANYSRKNEYSELDYAIIYSSIDTAENTYLILSSSYYLLNDIPNNNLFSIILEIKKNIMNEKDTIPTLFQSNSEASKLLYKLSENMYDVNSANRLLDILKSN